jgi:hypothetical protein
MVKHEMQDFFFFNLLGATPLTLRSAGLCCILALFFFTGADFFKAGPLARESKFLAKHGFNIGYIVIGGAAFWSHCPPRSVWVHFILIFLASKFFKLRCCLKLTPFFAHYVFCYTPFSLMSAVESARCATLPQQVTDSTLVAWWANYLITNSGWGVDSNLFTRLGYTSSWFLNFSLLFVLLGSPLAAVLLIWFSAKLFHKVYGP